MTIAYYLSHPQVQIDPAVPVPQWGLSDAGRARLATLAGAGWLASVRRIVSSDERKAIETAETLLPMTDAARVEILPGFHENDRSATGFLPPAEFEATADAFFAAPDQSVRGWERAADAQARILGAVDAVLADREAPVLFVGHGGVGTLLKCHLKGEPIARSADQAAEGGHPGGGNVHAFSIAERRHLFGWTALEQVAS
jgi:broad specificity phosphatase PhoE